MTADFWRKVPQPCPHEPGTRVEVTGLQPGDPDPMPVGSRGTIRGGNGAQLFVAWDDGRTLILLTSDPYRVLDGE